MEGKLAQGRVHVYSCTCVSMCTCVYVFFSSMCIHKVGRSLVHTTVFPANVSIRQKDVFLRDTYICTYSNIPLPYSGYVTLQIA